MKAFHPCVHWQVKAWDSYNYVSFSLNTNPMLDVVTPEDMGHADTFTRYLENEIFHEHNVKEPVTAK